MAAKGSIAKENVVKKLQEAFGSDWIGEFSKKYYVWAKDGNEKVQIAISLTCPKVQVGEVSTGKDLDFEFGTDTILGTVGFSPAEITQEETDTINALMERLGL
jgi:hypothetical protein